MQGCVNDNVSWKYFKWGDLFERVEDTDAAHGAIVKVTDTIILRPKDESAFKEKAAPFFVDEFKKLRTDDWEKAKNMTVRCPCKVVEEIDWAYMRKFIEEIEAELIGDVDIESILRRAIIKMS